MDLLRSVDISVEINVKPVEIAIPIPFPEDKQKRISPAGALYSGDLNEFLLKYEDIRKAELPHESLLEFLQSSYDAAADLAGWDRSALEGASALSAVTK